MQEQLYLDLTASYNILVEGILASIFYACDRSGIKQWLMLFWFFIVFDNILILYLYVIYIIPRYFQIVQ